VVADLHRRIVEIAVENKVVTGKRMRVDTTVVETNIHYPTDNPTDTKLQSKGEESVVA
jgi:transposase, IS5 family